MTDELFVIDTDKKADWAVKKIAEETAEKDRLVALAQAEIEELQERIAKLETDCEENCNYLKHLLGEYFGTVEHKQTKTRETYKLLNGTLVLKKARQEIKHDDVSLLEYFKNSGKGEFIRVTEKPLWADYKKRLEINGEVVVDTESGEVVDCLSIEEVPEVFSVAV